MCRFKDNLILTTTTIPSVSMTDMINCLPTWNSTIDTCDPDFAWSVTEEPLDPTIMFEVDENECYYTTNELEKQYMYLDSGASTHVVNNESLLNTCGNTHSVYNSNTGKVINTRTLKKYISNHIISINE